MKSIIVIRFFVAAFCAALVACGGGGSSVPAPITAAPPPPPSDFPVVLIDGDSLISAPYSGTWTDGLKAKVTADLWLNVGVGRTTTRDALAQYDAVLRQRAKAGGVYMLLSGTNDLREAWPVSEIYDNLSAMWQKARQDGMKVVAFTIASPGACTVYHPDNTYCEARRIALNQMIRASNGYDKLIEIDVIFPDITNLAYFYDGTHWTDAAENILADKVAAALKAMQQIMA